MSEEMTMTTMSRIRTATLMALLGAAASALAHGEPIIYPAKGQSPAQQDKDRYECYAWARAQSGFDPFQPSASPAPSQDPSAMQPSLSGMVKGAAGGAAIAELTDHSAGKGAAAGALGAVVFERARMQQAAQAKSQQASQQQAARRSTYERAFAACMEAREYVVK
jgi:hypothetical protein